MSKRRNLLILYGIALLQGMVFYAPVASLYRQAAGLHFTQIALIEGASYLLSLLLELPWGMIADRIGYRRTMICGCGFYFLSKIIFWQADSFSGFLLERILLSISIAALSGVEESILYLSCEKENRQRSFAISEACSTLGLLISAGAYSLFMGDNYRLAALSTMIAYGLAALLSLGIREVHPEKVRVGLPGFVRLLKDTLCRRRLLLFLAGMALFSEAAQMITVWLNQNQYLRCGMDGMHMGWAYIIVSAAALMGAFSQRFTQRMGERRFGATLLMIAAIVGLLLVLVRSAVLSVLLVAAVSMARGLLMPLASRISSDAVRTPNRATQLSVFAMIQNTFAAGASFALGRASDISLNLAFTLCALACILACAAFLCMCKPVRT